MSFANDLELKMFGALVNGLISIKTESIAGVDTPTIMSQVFATSKMSAPEITSFVTSVQKTLDQAAGETWAASDLATFLAETDLGGAQSEIFQSAWSKNEQKIYDHVVSKSNWVDGLKNVAWRIDVKNGSRSSAAAGGEPTAIMQLNLKSNTTAAQVGASDSIVFEMDREAVTDVLAKFTEIQALISSRG